MKKAVFIGLFIFSLAVNLAVAATVGWHLWRQSRASMTPAPIAVGASTLTREDLQSISQMCPPEARMKMIETRNRIMEKNLEVLDIVAKYPSDLTFADQKINELQVLKGQMDREAFSRISEILASLPEEKREAFVSFVKSRACMGPGMGMGSGRGPGCGPGCMRSPGQSQ